MWVDAPGYEGLYQVNELGKIRNKRTGRVLNSRPNANGGYLLVTLYDHESRAKTEYLHRLLALAFIPQPIGKRFVKHKDGDQYNCTIDNLYWSGSKRYIVGEENVGIK